MGCRCASVTGRPLCPSPSFIRCIASYRGRSAHCTLLLFARAEVPDATVLVLSFAKAFEVFVLRLARNLDRALLHAWRDIRNHAAHGGAANGTYRRLGDAEAAITDLTGATRRARTFLAAPWRCGARRGML